MPENTEKTKCLIIGSGPAGYTAAIYAARADLKPMLYQGFWPGGQLTITTDVENFPGYPEGISGTAMMEDLKKQAVRFGTNIRRGNISEVDFSKRPFTLKDDDGKIILAETVIIATGASAQWLGIRTESKFIGYGVSACATCDGFFYKGKVVAVIGGGDTAAEEATYLAKLCSKVYMIHRRDKLRASKAMQSKVFNAPNIEMVWNNLLIEIVGTNDGIAKTVNGVIIKNTLTDKETKLDVDGVFIAIGHKPNSELFMGKLELHHDGYIKTKPGSAKTSVEGVFAAGDIQDHTYRQAVTAAGSGCMAAIEVERYLSALD
jgi:thioredoxin reductase (NADPH)